MLCKECGAMNKDGALFCSQCGNLLNKEEVEEHKEEIINESHEDPIEEVKEEYVQNEDVKECVARGICKVNFATELRKAYTDACKKLLSEKPETYDPKKLGVVGIEAVKELVKGRMKVCGCDGKA